MPAIAEEKVRCTSAVDLECLLVALGNPKLVMVMSAFFDESGTHEDSPYASVAGYVFEPEQLVKLQEEWSEILPSGIELFHMSECVHGIGAFARFSKHDRDLIARRCIGAIKRRARCGIMSAVDSKQFARIANLKVVGDSYVMLVMQCVFGVSAWAEHRTTLDDRIALFFEAGHRKQSRAGSLLTRMEEDTPFVSMARFSSHTFIHNKKDSAGIQAADMLAWEWRSEMINHFGPIKRPRRKSFSSLLEAPHYYCVVSEDHLHAMQHGASLAENPGLTEFHLLDPMDRNFMTIRKDLLQNG